MAPIRKTGRLISKLYQISQSYFKNKLRKYNLGPGQIQILHTLFQKEHVSQQELATSLQIDKTSLARTISKLEEHGYVLRNKDKQDSRAYRISLTQKAHEVRDLTIPIFMNWTDTILTGFTSAEKDQFIDFLIRAIDNARTEVEGERHDTFCDAYNQIS